MVVAYNSGAHLNPAVTLGLVANGAKTFGSAARTRWCRSTSSPILLYILAQLIGAIIGAVVTWLAYKQHFDEEPDPANKLGVFSTGPAIRTYGWNLVTEIIGTFVLVFVVIAFGHQPGRRGRTRRARRPARRPPRDRHRCLPRWSDRVRHQPGP